MAIRTNTRLLSALVALAVVGFVVANFGNVISHATVAGDASSMALHGVREGVSSGGLTHASLPSLRGGEHAITQSATNRPVAFSPGSVQGTAADLWGRIFLDSNRTGNPAAGDWYIELRGTGCPGRQLPLNVTVTWSGPSGGSAVPDDCNPDAYYVANLPAGTYEVSISLPPGWGSTSPSSIEVSVGGGVLSEASFGIAPNGSYGTRVVPMNASVTTQAPSWYPIIAYPFSVPSPFNFVGLAGSVTLSAAAIYSMGEDLTSFRVDTDGHCPVVGTTWANYTAFYAEYPNALSESAFILKAATPGTVSVPTQFTFPVKVPEHGCIFILLNGGDLGHDDPVTLTSDMYLLYDLGAAPSPAPYLIGMGGESCCTNLTQAAAFAFAIPVHSPLRFWALAGDVSSGEFWGGPWFSKFDFFVYPSCPPPPLWFSGPANYYSQIPSGAQRVLSLNLSATGVSSIQSAVDYLTDGGALASGKCIVELWYTAASASSVDQETQCELLVQDPTVPLAPRGLVAIAHGSRVNLSWSSPSDDGGFPIAYYEVYRGTSTGGESLLAAVGDVLNYSDLSVTNGSKYYYEVSAVNSLGESQRSTEAAAVVGQATYAVKFTESGLPSGTSWWVNVTGGPSTLSGSTTLMFSEPNGTYPYSVATADKTYSSSGGSFLVDDATTSVTTDFSRVAYTVIFLESGLPLGKEWSVTFDRVTESGTGAIAFTGIANGTYGFTIGSVAGYASTPSVRSITVMGPPNPQLIVFQQSPSPATFLGLAATEGYAVLGGVVAAIVLAAAVTLLWSRRWKAPPGLAKSPTRPSNGGRSGPP